MQLAFSMQQFTWFSTSKASSYFFQTSSLFPATSSKALFNPCFHPIPSTINLCCPTLPLQVLCSFQPNKKIPPHPQQNKFTSCCWGGEHPPPTPSHTLGLYLPVLTVPTPLSACAASTHSLLYLWEIIPSPALTTNRLSGYDSALPITLKPLQARSQHPCLGALASKCQFHVFPSWDIFVCFLQAQGLRNISVGLSK